MKHRKGNTELKRNSLYAFILPTSFKERIKLYIMIYIKFYATILPVV